MVVVAAVGLALVVLSPVVMLAFAGLLLMGIGTSALFPMAIAAAARLGDRPAATNVASLSQMAFVAGIATQLLKRPFSTADSSTEPSGQARG